MLKTPLSLSLSLSLSTPTHNVSRTRGWQKLSEKSAKKPSFYPGLARSAGQLPAKEYLEVRSKICIAKMSFTCTFRSCSRAN